MDELISKIDVEAIERAISKGVEYGGEFFLRFQGYAIMINLIWLLLSWIVLLICIFTFKPLRAWVKEGEASYSNDRVAVWVVWAIPLVASVAFIAVLFNALVKAYFVPEVYLFQYITN